MTAARIDDTELPCVPCKREDGTKYVKAVLKKAQILKLSEDVHEIEILLDE